MTTFDMPPTGTWEQRGGWVVRALMMDLGLTLNQASGIAGNLGYESAGFTKLQEIRPAVGGSRGGYGWSQWTGSRRRAFEAWCKSNGLLPASDEANYGFLIKELRTTHKSTVADLKMTATLSGAVFSVGLTYERPGGTTATHLPGFEGRLDYAGRALAGSGGEFIDSAPASVATTVDAAQPAPPAPHTRPAHAVKPPASVAVTPLDALKAMQIVMRGAGAYAGEIDGRLGPQSFAAINVLLEAADQDILEFVK